jgi:primary-amine oxidase
MSTATIETIDQTASAAPDHPLTPLTADEIRAVRRIVDAHGLLGESVRFVYTALEEPHKNVVLSFTPGDPIERRARVIMLDRHTGQGTDLIVSITDGQIVYRHDVDPVTDGQVPVLDEEFGDVEPILLECDEWLAAMRKRGLDPTKVRALPLSAGAFGHEDEVGKRVARVLGFYQFDEADLPWGHPIDGVVAHIDLRAKQVMSVVDHDELPFPGERAEWDAEPHATPARTDLKPIEITQP